MLISPRRAGVTLLELIVVIAAMLILGAAVLPTLTSVSRDTNVKGAADLCVGRIAEARGYAIEQGRAYRFSCSPDGKRIRVSLDEVDSSGQPLEASDVNPMVLEDNLPNPVMITPNITSDEQTSADSAGWIRLATFLPDGTCREQSADFKLTEDGVVPFLVQIRGLTGTTTVAPYTGAKK